MGFVSDLSKDLGAGLSIVKRVWRFSGMALTFSALTVAGALKLQPDAIHHILGLPEKVIALDYVSIWLVIAGAGAIFSTLLLGQESRSLIASTTPTSLALKAAPEEESKKWQTRIAELEKDRDGWRTDFNRMQDANLALAAVQAKVQQAVGPNRSPTLEQVKKVRRQRTEQAKRDAINGYVARVEQARRDDPAWLNKRSNLDPEWTHWIRLERVPLWQAVCLSFDIDPDKLPNASTGTADLRKLTAWENRHLDPGRNYFKERLQEAGAHFQVPLDGMVSLPEFALWALDDAEWKTWPQEFAVLSGSTKAIDLR